MRIGFLDGCCAGARGGLFSVTQPPPDSDFKGDTLHGQTTTFTDPKLKVIFFAAVFLPGKIRKANDGQKE